MVGILVGPNQGKVLDSEADSNVLFRVANERQGISSVTLTFAT